MSAARQRSSAADASSAGSNAWKVDAIGLAALLGLTAAAYLFGAAPLLERHASLAQQQQELVAERLKSLDTAHTLASAQDQSAHIEQQFVQSPLRLEPGTLLNQRLALVNELAAETGSLLDDLQPGKIVDGPQFGALSIHVVGTGTYTTFAAFLRRLRERCPDSGITAFDVSCTPLAEQEAPAKFSFDLAWYTQPSKAAVAAASGEGEAKARGVARK
jgi:Tfp pilus assembly protein PilO